MLCRLPMMFPSLRFSSYEVVALTSLYLRVKIVQKNIGLVMFKRFIVFNESFFIFLFIKLQISLTLMVSETKESVFELRGEEVTKIAKYILYSLTRYKGHLKILSLCRM